MHDLSRGRLIVTGGAGLIGSAVIWALNRRGIDDILVVDRLDIGEKWRNLVPLRYADYLDADDFEHRLLEQPRSFDGVCAVVHLGACSATTERDAGFLMRNNYAYTKHVAHWCVAADVRLLYASSAATYGAMETDLSDSCALDTLRPLNAYAYSKHRFDLYAADNGILDRLCGVKYFNIFGPNESHKGDMRSVVQKAYEQIQATGRVALFKSYRPEFSDGEQRRDFLYVKDAAEMTLHLLESDTCGLVNVGAGRAQTWLDLVRPIFRSLNLPERIDFIEMPDALRGKYQYVTCATIDKLLASGYRQPIASLDDTVHDYVTQYLVPDKRLDPADAPIALCLERRSP